ncbi:hypothetical protein ACIGKR_12165 [Rhodococcus qingshengii]|uniref:hypothetical protein n=1 Tax=Rhodococcus qingshengii TaxID=334542 RepID=UPI0037CC5057
MSIYLLIPLVVAVVFLLGFSRAMWLLLVKYPNIASQRDQALKAGDLEAFWKHADAADVVLWLSYPTQVFRPWTWRS